MFKLKFRIDKQYLIAHSIKRLWRFCESPFPEWSKLSYDLNKKYPAGIDFLSDPSLSFLGKTLSKNEKQAKKIISEILKTKQFQRLYKETNVYLKMVKKQWDQNKKIAVDTIKNLSGLEMPLQEIKVFITHPKTGNGMAIPYYDAIMWGHSEDLPNYSTIYICHELMHLLTQGAKNQDIMHVLIEFMTDKKLREIVNNEKLEYIERVAPNMPPHIKNKINLSRKILPYWEEYLTKKKPKNIFELEKYIIKKIAE